MAIRPWLCGEVTKRIAERRQLVKDSRPELARDLRAEIQRTIRSAKSQYAQRIEKSLKQNKPVEAWRCLKHLLDINTKHSGT